MSITKNEIDKSTFLIVKDNNNGLSKLIVSPNDFQIGLNNSPSTLKTTGKATFSQGLTSNGHSFFNQGLSGSLTRLPNGISYLVAGNGITITSASNGQVIISSAGGSGDVVGPASSTINAIAKFTNTTGKLLSNTNVTIDGSNNVTIPGRIVVTGGTTSNADATLGNAALGSFPFYDGGASSGVYAMFGHKDLDHSTSITNYALYQDNTGNTVVNASNNKTLFLSVNNTTMGFLTNNLIGTGIDAISLTGDSATKTNILLGNTTSDSSTSLQAGSGGVSIQAGNASAVGNINIGTDDTYSTRTIKIGSDGDSTATQQQDIQIGAKNTSGYNRVRICDGNSYNGHEVDIISHAFSSTKTTSYSLVNIGTVNALSYINIGGVSPSPGGGINTNAVKKITIGSEYSDSFVKIRNGTGCVTMQDQPCFLAFRDNTTQSVPNTGAFDVRFNSERFDTQSNYDTSTWTFTAPVTGKYIFNVSVRIDTLDSTANYYYLSLVTSNATYQLSIIDPNFSSNLDYYWMCGSVIVDMDTSDTAKVQLRQSGGTNNLSTIVDDVTAGQVCSYFSGWLLG